MWFFLKLLPHDWKDKIEHLWDELKHCVHPRPSHPTSVLNFTNAPVAD